ncbi:hypothetical protein CMI42_05915 [Candidatus Pacearchaeota archaeon]|nr:hypothetical protein [Candidatus Pacearchaeota archaeon]
MERVEKMIKNISNGNKKGSNGVNEYNKLKRGSNNSDKKYLNSIRLGTKKNKGFEQNGEPNLLIQDVDINSIKKYLRVWRINVK